MEEDQEEIKIGLAEEYKMRGFSDPDINRGDWFFDRLSIDKYRERQALHYKILELEIRDLEKRLGYTRRDDFD